MVVVTGQKVHAPEPDPASTFLLVMIIVSFLQFFGFLVLELDSSSLEASQTRSFPEFINRWTRGAKKTATCIGVGCFAMIMSHLFFYLKLQEPNPEIHTIESIVQVMSISVAELCFVVFIWVRSESIWKAYLSSSYIRFMRWMMNVLGALIFIQQVPKIIQWTRNDTSRPLAIAVILSSVLVAFFIFALDAIFLSVFLKVLKKQDEHVTEQSEFPILAKYGIGQLLMGCFALISLIVASILGANHKYYNLAYGITYMFMNGIFCVAIAMKIALYRRAKRLEAKNTSGGKSGEKKKKRKMFFEKSKSMILPSGRKSIDQGGAIGMYTVPFSTIQEGDSSAEQSILNDGEKEKRSERSSKAQASVIIEMDRRSERSSQNR